MEEIDLKDVFKMFWEKKLKVILIVLIFVIIGIIYSSCFVTPMYSSSTTLVLASSNRNNSNNTSYSSDDNSITTTDLSINSKLVSTYSELVKSKNVLRKVINNLNINIDENTLRKNIKVSSVKDTELIEITVSNEKKHEATRIANEIAKVFMEKIESIYNIENVQVVDEAEDASKPANINYKRDVLIFTLVGMVVAGAYVLIANMMDTTVKSAEEIEQNYNLPILASIPVYEGIQKSKKGGK